VINISNRLNQKLTYWTANSRNEYNEIAYSSPVTINCRLGYTDKVSHSDTGISKSKTVVLFTTTEIPLEAKMLLGTHTDTAPPTPTTAITSVNPVFDINGDLNHYEIFFG